MTMTFISKYDAQRRGNPLSWSCSGFHGNPSVCSVATETATTASHLSEEAQFKMSFPFGTAQKWDENLNLLKSF